MWHSAKEYIANREFENKEELEKVVNQLLNEGGLIIIPFFFICVTTNASLASIRAWMSVMDLEIWY
ncbi:hypothetical protein C789_4968 [Microcystis aeruginosa FACHB-905 = DIANCHI905]|uniref:Uncharacterized protein n=1 Tax=Microcystis aeruginosa PCC 7806SL TaxID=1903187 RepID=A0AB33BYM5_MICA7|nr:hypothetical protein BH695_3171 [Microcystis aeruginosa PCC 7806SL]ELS45235.1 hypothetical protein C789_4968 [Microcystis aeruginosa FACHB-905 = DIANCHI905]